MHQIRTDLAMESWRAQQGAELPGVSVSTWDAEGASVTEVVIETDAGADLVGKPVGKYVTLECPLIAAHDPDAREAAAGLLGEELALMLPEGDGPVLVIGLGNRMVTPDSLGPKVVDGTLVTRHLYEALPDAVDERMRPVCAIAPGVLGITGVETQEIALGIVQHIAPRAVIAIDALAAQSSHRIGTTIQLTDSGIQPGSGVGNRRKAITCETMGAPVIAIGVPTVVDAGTLVADLTEQAGRTGIRAEDFERFGGGMVVTPKEIDKNVSDIAKLVGYGINMALHPGITVEDINLFIS